MPRAPPDPRLTMFVTGYDDSRTDNADQLRPLVASGHIQLGNHTWSHPDLSTLADADVTAELSRNSLADDPQRRLHERRAPLIHSRLRPRNWPLPGLMTLLAGSSTVTVTG